VGLYWVPGHVGVRGNETADGLARNSFATGCVGLEPALGISRQDLRNKIGHWLENEHRRRWQNLGNSQRQARELISEPSRGTKVRFLLQSRHNILCRHLHLMGLIDSPLCRKCGVEDETSVHILCWCEGLASIWHAHLSSFFLEPADIKSENLGSIWCFSKAAGLP
jgi:hypothetical protein